MKINNIAALDYQIQDGLLVLVLTDTSMEDVTHIDGSLLTVKTDDGDTVEVLAGYALRSVTYDLAAGTYQAALAPAMEDTTAVAYAKLAAELAGEKEKVTQLEAANADIMDALLELATIVVGGAE